MSDSDPIDTPSGEAATPEPTPPIEVRAVPFDPGAPGEAGARTVDAPPPTAPPSSPSSSSGEAKPERNHAWAMACHLVALIDFGVPLFLVGIAAPLVLWLWKKDEDPEVDYHGKESLNFQLNLLFWTVVSTVLVCCLIGIPMLIALPLVKLVLIVIASIHAAQGERFEYPMIYRAIR